MTALTDHLTNLLTELLTVLLIAQGPGTKTRWEKKPMWSEDLASIGVAVLRPGVTVPVRLKSIVNRLRATTIN